MNGSVLRTATRSSRSWRMRQWPNDPTVAHLIFVDHVDVPTADQVRHAVEHAQARGARALRTSALFPPAAGVVLAEGFHPIDRLALLSRPISVRSAPPAGRPTRPMLPWHLAAAAEVDRDAFGPMWGNDTASLRDVRRATPRHRARIVRDGRSLAGFAISGAAGDHGYLQRLAVGSTHRRAGYASDLVADALRWMHTEGLTSVLVNTGVDNHAALALYDRFGFRRLDEELTIAELRFEPPAPPEAHGVPIRDHDEPPAPREAHGVPIRDHEPPAPREAHGVPIRDHEPPAPPEAHGVPIRDHDEPPAPREAHGVPIRDHDEPPTTAAR